MPTSKTRTTAVNDSGTQAPADTGSAHGRSGPVLYEIVAKDGRVFGWNIVFDTATKAAKYAKILWPDQQQDPERTGAGWDVQVARCGTCHDRGEVGGFVNAESGYQTDPCPDCSSVREG